MNCPACGKSTPFTSGSFCSFCGALLNESSPQHQGTEHAVSSEKFENTVAWESTMRREAPLKALFSTLLAVIFQPAQFYRTAVTTCTTAPFPALWFGLITGSLGVTGSWLWSLVLHRYASILGEYSTFLGTMSISSTTLITAPLVLILQYVLLAAYTRIAIHFFRHEKASTAQIIRVLCYAESTSILIFIPFAGYVIALVAGIYSVLTGLHTLLGVSRIRLFFILILPVAVLVGVILLLIAGGMVGGVLAGASIFNQRFPFLP